MNASLIILLKLLFELLIILFGVLGADEIITFSNDSYEANFYEKSVEQSFFMTELLSRNDKYDVSTRKIE